MGLLSEGKPLSWADTKKNAALVHRVGIQQFLALYRRLKDRKGDVLKWGDEVGPIHGVCPLNFSITRAPARTKQLPDVVFKHFGFFLFFFAK